MSTPVTELTYIQNYEFFSITQAAPRGGKILCDPGDGGSRIRVQDVHFGFTILSKPFSSPQGSSTNFCTRALKSS